MPEIGRAAKVIALAVSSSPHLILLNFMEYMGCAENKIETPEQAIHNHRNN